MSTSTLLEESPVGNHVGNLISSPGIFSFSGNDFEEYYNKKMSLSTQEIDENIKYISLKQRKKKKSQKRSCVQDQQYDDCNVQPQHRKAPNTQYPSSQGTDATFMVEHEQRKKGILKKEIQRWSKKVIRKEKASWVRSAGCLS